MNLPLVYGIIGLSVGGAVLLAIIIWFIATYNTFVSMRSSCEEAFSTMDVYLKKRYDLIPNLVNTVKGYAAHEAEVLEKVTAARAHAQAASTAEEKIAANAELTRALRSVNIVAENYPALKADTSFLNLQSSLSSVEREIANARKYYNAVVKQLNAKREKIPSNLIAKVAKIKKMPYFEVEDETERQNVKVEF